MNKYNPNDETSVLPDWMRTRPKPMSDAEWDRLGEYKDKIASYVPAPVTTAADNIMAAIDNFMIDVKVPKWLEKINAAADAHRKRTGR